MTQARCILAPSNVILLHRELPPRLIPKDGKGYQFHISCGEILAQQFLIKDSMKPLPITALEENDFV